MAREYYQEKEKVFFEMLRKTFKSWNYGGNYDWMICDFPEKAITLIKKAIEERDMWSETKTEGKINYKDLESRHFGVYRDDFPKEIICLPKICYILLRGATDSIFPEDAESIFRVSEEKLLIFRRYAISEGWRVFERNINEEMILEKGARFFF